MEEEEQIPVAIIVANHVNNPVNNPVNNHIIHINDPQPFPVRRPPNQLQEICSMAGCLTLISGLLYASIYALSIRT